MNVCLSFIFLNLTLCLVESARILGIFHGNAFSHQRLGLSLLQGLAAKGHEITMVTPMVPKESIPNLKVIKITTNMPEEVKNRNKFDITNLGALSQAVLLDMMGLKYTEDVLQDENVQKLLKSDEKFDAVIMENFLNEAFRGFCYHYNVPCILLSTIVPTRWVNPQMGNPASPSYVPDMYAGYSSHMTFLERLHNSIIYVAAELFAHLYTFPKQNEIMHKFFPNAPHLYDLYYNTSLMLINSDVSLNAPIPHVPNMIDIGGYHVNPPKKLPKDLQDFLDSATEGAIFFSMGSHLDSKDMPKEKLNDILKAFSKLKQKVLWKFEEESLPGQPENLKISKWIPQQDVLAHPNIKLFITHGGLLSTIETIYHGIPIIGIPILGDQDINVANAKIAGYGIGLRYKSLNEKVFSDAINEVLHNPSYSENAKRRSKIMHDKPMKPMERATFWVEYVIRHQGAPHLKTAAINLSWYQYLLLDVVAVVILFALIISFALCKIIKMIFAKRTKNVKRTKKTN